MLNVTPSKPCFTHGNVCYQGDGRQRRRSSTSFAILPVGVLHTLWGSLFVIYALWLWVRGLAVPDDSCEGLISAANYSKILNIS
jgi:hypothetical protein